MIPDFKDCGSDEAARHGVDSEPFHYQSAVGPQLLPSSEAVAITGGVVAGVYIEDKRGDVDDTKVFTVYSISYLSPSSLDS